MLEPQRGDVNNRQICDVFVLILRHVVARCYLLPIPAALPQAILPRTVGAKTEFIKFAELMDIRCQTTRLVPAYIKSVLKSCISFDEFLA